ncbi:MAG: bifunctional folylpolyglutamate synthase/dihydrofolate synthase [Flavobacteriales bacterium]|nr:bifunctional folylpolyglutamate synthase/dihydrofolate synthase [Flavobacteriales bacterium]
MNYQETLDYLFSQLPMYQRIGKSAYKADLNNTIKLCSLLGNPEKGFKSVHIAGTNGKGSTSHLLASVLQEAGYKVGLYTSPHLIDFRERIKINGKMIPENNIVTFIEQYKNDFESIALSFFEMTVGMAFDFFSKEKVDIAIIETGLGGRLDSTNVITPELSVITNISHDHTQFLGNTLEKIATEKAGIIKRDIPVIIGETQQDTESIFIKKAQELSSPILFADQLEISKIVSSQNISYKRKNTQTAIITISELIKKGWKITNKNIENGITNTNQNTGLQGRWQTLHTSPLAICDTGHNASGISLVVLEIQKLEYDNLHFILGTVDDKNINDILNILPKKAQYYFCKANIPRALNAEKLKETASQHNLRGHSFQSVFEAVISAKSSAKSSDLIFIGGSTFVVAEALQNKSKLFGDTIK